jgi:hypothetical protein
MELDRLELEFRLSDRLLDARVVRVSDRSPLVIAVEQIDAFLILIPNDRERRKIVSFDTVDCVAGLPRRERIRQIGKEKEVCAING